MALDVLADAVDALIAAGADAHLVRRVLSDVRQRWSGERVYISKTDRHTRDATIREAIAHGAPPERAAAQAGVTPRTVRRRQSTWL